MILEGSTIKRIGKTGTSYYEVLVQCPKCLRQKYIERNRAKKSTHSMCGNCYRQSDLNRERHKGHVPPNRQIKCLTPCMYCDKMQERSKRRLLKHKYVFCNASCQIKWQLNNTDFNRGINSPSYKHGERINGQLPNYGSEFNKFLKRDIKIRDGFNCQKCNKNFSGEKSKSLDVHHIDENKFNNNPNNLTCLCKSCHIKEHRYIQQLKKKEG